MAAEWRLVVDVPADGAWNMSMDRAMQLARERGEAPPTLRLYRWAVPTISLGRFQDASVVDAAACNAAGVDVVRRSTGGRAVLHDDELTYSVTASTSDGVPRGVAASYRYLSEALAAAYRALGVEAEIVRRDAAANPTAACYLASTRADLSLRGVKLSGSAQVWHGSTVLQHGSFVRSRDVVREAALLGLTPEQAVELGAHTATLESAGVQADFDSVAEAVIEAFERTLGITLRLMEASQSEISSARTLAHGFTVATAPPSR